MPSSALEILASSPLPSLRATAVDWSPAVWARIADAIVLVHFAFVAFVALGLPAIWVGWLCRARWPRNFWFRATHLAMMTVVVLESTLGITCPLTTWESEARMRAGQDGYHDKGFIEYWTHRLMFFDLGPTVFFWIYVAFFVLLIGSLVFIRPELPPWLRRGRGSPD